MSRRRHALCLADINGDKLPDLVTGKRWWAHGPTGDIEPDNPAVIVWFELSRKDGTAEFNAHRVDDDSGIGTQFQWPTSTATGCWTLSRPTRRVPASSIQQKP